MDITEGDFYKRLFAISNSNKNLNFARVSMDLINKENNFMGLKEVLNEEGISIFIAIGVFKSSL